MTESDPLSIRTLATTTHGRYVVRRARGARPHGTLVAFHGYAQEAEAFLAEIDTIPSAHRWLVVSIQGLHRFYTRAGDVVASWMTRQDRELAIADNVAYVRAVIDFSLRDEGVPVPPSLPIVFFGFSQGVAMAFRAATHANRCDGVIALGGDVPPDVRAQARRVGPVLLARGSQDEWYARETFDADVAWLREGGQLAEVCEFDAGHVWTDAFRERAGAFLDRIAGARAPLG